MSINFFNTEKTFNELKKQIRSAAFTSEHTLSEFFELNYGLNWADYEDDGCRLDSILTDATMIEVSNFFK